MKQRIYRCRRCKHVWKPRKSRKPRSCPHCKSAFVDRSSKGLITTRKRFTLNLQKGKHPRAKPKKIS